MLASGLAVNIYVTQVFVGVGEVALLLMSSVMTETLGNVTIFTASHEVLNDENLNFFLRAQQPV